MEPLKAVADQDAAALERGIERFLADLQNLEQLVGSQDRDEEIRSGLTEAVYRMTRCCKAFEEAVADKEKVKAAQADFRKRTDHFFIKSYFVNRARTWPMGYPGDYETIESIYRNVPMSTGIGYYFDIHFLEMTLAKAVRARKELIRDILRQELFQRKEPAILNIACGSCREIVELSRELKSSGGRVICVDIDSNALEFASGRLAHANLPSSQVLFRKYNAIKMISHERNVKEFGLQDVIYSLGLFDYLDDAILSRLLQTLYELLNPGGQLIATFKDRSQYETYEYHWFVDWSSFYQRSVEDARRIIAAAGIPEASVAMQRDATGVILFFRLAR